MTTALVRDFGWPQLISASAESARFINPARLRTGLVTGRTSEIVVRPTEGSHFETLRQFGSAFRTVMTLNTGGNEYVIDWMWDGATGGAPSKHGYGLTLLPLEAPAPGQNRVDRLAGVQEAFALPLQTLARLLGISRPQLYKWLDAERNIALQTESLSRLEAAYELAQLWRQFTDSALSKVASEPSAIALRIQEIMAHDPIPMAQLEAVLKQLVAQGPAITGPSSKSARLRAAGFKARDSRHSLPSDE